MNFTDYDWYTGMFSLITEREHPNSLLTQSPDAAAAAKSLQSCLTLCDPIDGSPQAPSSLGLSRQEHWSGLPFSSPKHESEKWKWSRSVVSDSSRPRGLQPIRLLRPWDFPGKSTGVGCHCLLQIYIQIYWLICAYIFPCQEAYGLCSGNSVVSGLIPKS